MVAVAGAAFALIGAGVGAAVGNTPGALTGIYLLDLGVLPVLQTVKPALADKIDPGNAVLEPRPGRTTRRSRSRSSPSGSGWPWSPAPC